MLHRALERNMTTYVYILVDPRDSRIRYVGQTYDPDRRYKDHLRSARNGYTSQAKFEWLQSLQQCKMRPAMVIVEVTTGHYALARESYWIARLSFAGAPLLNPWYAIESAQIDFPNSDPVSTKVLTNYT